MSQDGSGGPNPFSREGSQPEDALGGQPSGARPASPATPTRTPEWPAYPEPPTWGGGPSDVPADARGGRPAPDPAPYAPTPYAPSDTVGLYAPSPYAAGYGFGLPYGVAPQHPQAVTALVLAIVGLVVCPPVGIAGLVMGVRVRRDSDAHPGQFSGRGLGTAAMVLGIIAVVGMIFWIVVFGGIAASDY